MNPLLESLLNELKALILRNEGRFAPLVQADFEDDLDRSESPIHTTYGWIKMYQGQV